MSIQTDLQEFYDAQAEKYYHTRNKHRADAPIFLDEIKKSKKKTITILEFWCGSGRLLASLLKIPEIKIQYIWVDISKNLLRFAKKQLASKSKSKHISATFVCDDILHYIQWCTQESFDFVIWVASFQHIPTIKERFSLMKNTYRILTYEGKLMMTNRSFSLRFLKKYKKNLLHSLVRYLASFGKQQWNNLMIPWKNTTKTSKRFYHIYTIAELKKIITMSGFVITQIGYLKKWKIIDSWKDSQNSLLIAEKNIFGQQEHLD